MIATELVVDVDVEKIEYPLGEVYAGEAAIVVKFEKPVRENINVTLRYQPCDESACLIPVTRRFEVLAPSPSGRGSG